MKNLNVLTTTETMKLVEKDSMREWIKIAPTKIGKSATK